MLITFFVFTPGMEKELNAEVATAMVIVAVVGALVLTGWIFANEVDVDIEWNKASNLAAFVYENMSPSMQQIYNDSVSIAIAGEVLSVDYTASMIDAVKEVYINLVKTAETSTDQINWEFLVPTTNYTDEFNNLYKSVADVSDLVLSDIKVNTNTASGSIYWNDPAGYQLLYWNGNQVTYNNLSVFQSATNIIADGVTYHINWDRSLMSAVHDDVGTYYDKTNEEVRVASHYTTGEIVSLGRLYDPDAVGSISIPQPHQDYSPYSISGLWKKDAILDNNTLNGSDVLANDVAIDIPYDNVDYRASSLLGLNSAALATNSLASSVPYDYDYSVPATIAAWSEYTGDMNEMSLPQIIVQKFPFSIPFDLAIAFSALVADPEIPIFETDNLVLAGVDGGTLILDFTPFEPLAKIIRWGVLIGFNIGLILLTRRLIRG